MKSNDNQIKKNIEHHGRRHEMVYPFKRQIYSYDCGASCMETVLTYFGYDAREDHIMKIAGTDKNGTSTEGLIKVAKKFGLKYKAGENMTITDLKKCISRKHPRITPIQAWGTLKIELANIELTKDDIPNYQLDKRNILQSCNYATS